MDPAHGVFYLQQGWNGNYQVTAGVGVGDKQGSKGRKIGEAVGSWDRASGPRVGMAETTLLGLLLPGAVSSFPLSLIPLELCTGLNQLHTYLIANWSQHPVFLKKSSLDSLSQDRTQRKAMQSWVTAKVPSPGLLSGETSRTALDLQGKDRN